MNWGLAGVLYRITHKSVSFTLTGEIFSSLHLCQSRPVVSLTLPLGMENTENDC